MAKLKTKTKKRADKKTAKPAQRVIAEDLTTDGEAEGAPSALSERPTQRPQWQRWVVNKETKVGRWEVYELLEYQRSKEDLWHRLCEADVPLPFADVMGNLDAFASCAVKLLYLLSHEPWQYRHLRSDTEQFIEVMEEWGNVNVPRDRTIDAVTLILSIHNAAHKKTDGDQHAAKV